MVLRRTWRGRVFKIRTYNEICGKRSMRILQTDKQIINMENKTQRTFNHQGEETEGMYRYTIIFADGSKEIHRHAELDIFSLRHQLDHCEIKSFKMELE